MVREPRAARSGIIVQVTSIVIARDVVGAQFDEGDHRFAPGVAGVAHIYRDIGAVRMPNSGGDREAKRFVGVGIGQPEIELAQARGVGGARAQTPFFGIASRLIAGDIRPRLVQQERRPAARVAGDTRPRVDGIGMVVQGRPGDRPGNIEAQVDVVDEHARLQILGKAIAAVQQEGRALGVVERLAQAFARGLDQRAAQVPGARSGAVRQACGARAETARFEGQAQILRVRSGQGNEVHGAAQGGRPHASAARPAVHLDGVAGVRFQARHDVRAVGPAQGQAVLQQQHAALRRVLLQSRSAHLNAHLIVAAEEVLCDHPGHRADGVGNALVRFVVALVRADDAGAAGDFTEPCPGQRGRIVGQRRPFGENDDLFHGFRPVRLVPGQRVLRQRRQDQARDPPVYRPQHILFPAG